MASNLDGGADDPCPLEALHNVHKDLLLEPPALTLSVLELPHSMLEMCPRSKEPCLLAVSPTSASS